MAPKKAIIEELEFFAYQWAVEESPDYSIVRCYGFTEKNKNVHAIMKNLLPWCYVELPSHIEWTAARRAIVVDKLSQVGKKDFRPLSSTFLERKKLYYAWKEEVTEKDKKNRKEGDPELLYKDKLFPFVYLEFCSSSALMNFKYQVERGIEFSGLGKLELKVHEQHQIRREKTGEITSKHTILKLFAKSGIPAAGWIKVKGEVQVDKESECDHEILCKISDVKASDKKTIVQPRVACFDCEANSTITSAMPNPAMPNDKLFQIGVITLIKGKKKKYLFSLGNPDKNLVGKDTKLINSIKVKVNGKKKKRLLTEADLLVEFSKFLKKKKINVLIGYNTLGWDFEYMINRAKFTKCLNEFNVMDVMNGRHCPEVGNGFQSKAYTAQKLVYLETLGILQLDLLPIIKREYKINNYRLKTVTTHFGLPSKDPFTPQDIFRAYREFSPKSLGEVGHYCVQDAWITMLLFEKLQMWFGLCEMANTAHVPIFYLFTEGTQIQMLSQVMQHCMYNNIVMINNGYVPKEGEDDYMGATVLNPVPGKYKKILCFDFASLYPSIMMSHNIDYSTLVPEPEMYIISMHEKSLFLEKWKQFPAFLKVCDEKEKINIWEPIEDTEELEDKVRKIRKKHPNKVILIQKEKSSIPDEHCHVFSFEEHSGCDHDHTRKRLKNGNFSKAKKKIICGARFFRFMRAEYAGKGVVPLLLELLINSRKDTRKEIKVNETILQKDYASLIKSKEFMSDSLLGTVEKYLEEFKADQKEILENIDEIIEKTESKELSEKDIKEIIEKMKSLVLLNKVLDKRQSSKKICANSMYGAMGVKKHGLLPLLPGAMCVTYRGRTALEFISVYIPEKYNGIAVYGDTDSVMCYFPHVKDNKSAVELANNVIKEMLNHFPAPMKLEFEKIYEKYIILTKKRYMAYVANTKGEITGFTKKGVALVRRENCAAFKRIYLQTAKALLDDHSDEDILNDVFEGINSIFQRQHSYKDFVITKTYNGNYKTKTLPAHAQQALKMINRGIPVVAGSRIEYLFTIACRGEKNFSQGEKVEDLDYFARWREVLRLDYLYYLEKQFIKPLDELLKVGLGIEDFVKRQYELRLAKFYLNEELEAYFRPQIIIDGVEEEDDYKIRRRVVKKGGLETKKKKPTPRKKKIIEEVIIVSEDDSEDDSDSDDDSPKIVILEDEEMSPQEEMEMLSKVSLKNEDSYINVE